MSRLAVFLLLIVLSGNALCQYNTRIRSARPGRSFGAFTTGQNIFQIQTGFMINAFDVENVNQDGNGFNYLASFRYGITETVEIRSAFQINRDEVNSEGVTTVSSGVSVWNAGVRFNILDNAGTYKPSIGFQADFRINAVGEDFNPDHIAPRMIILHGQKLAQWLNLTSNWGVSWNGNNATPQGFYTLNFSFPLSDRLNGFVENFGQLVSEDFDSRFDAGIGFFITDNLLYDFSAGYGKNDGTMDYFFDTGISWRFRTSSPR